MVGMRRVSDTRGMNVEENEALVRRFVREVLQDLNANAVDDLIAPDFVSHTWGIDKDGRAALKKVTERLGSALSDIEFKIEDVIAAGDRVVTRLTASATQVGEFQGIAASGRRYRIGEIHIFRVADGLIAEHWHQYDLPGLMKQLGGDSAPQASGQ